MRNPVECIDPECDEEIIAMSPDADCYYDYESIPRLPAHRFLMLKEGTIIADGWLIQIACTEECLEFITNPSFS